MTEIANGISQNQDSLNSSSSGNNSAQALQEVKAPAEERLFRQSDVNDIVKKVKYEAVEDYKRIASSQPEYAQKKYGNNVPDNSLQSDAHNTSPGLEDYRKVAAEEAKKHFESVRQQVWEKSQEEAAKKTAESFHNKISIGREKYSDFDNVVGSIKFDRFLNTVELVTNYVDNSHDVLYALGNDRTKLAAIENLADRSKEDAIIELNKLSNSIKSNQVSSNKHIPNEPLSQTKPSNAGTDNGVLSVTDYRKKYRV